MRLELGADIDGLVLRTTEQSAGRGRRGRSWSGTFGGSYQTVAVRGADGGEGARRTAAPTTLAVAIGIAEVLRESGARVDVKWPNDLFYRGKKLGGILAEHVRGYLLIGVGVNVHNTVPEGAIGLVGWDVDAVGAAVLEGVERGLDAVRSGARLVERFAALDLLSGTQVRVNTSGTIVEGHANGIDEQGRLLVIDNTKNASTAIADGSIGSWLATDNSANGNQPQGERP